MFKCITQPMPRARPDMTAIEPVSNPPSSSDKGIVAGSRQLRDELVRPIQVAERPYLDAVLTAGLIVSNPCVRCKTGPKSVSYRIGVSALPKAPDMNTKGGRSCRCSSLGLGRHSDLRLGS